MQWTIRLEARTGRGDTQTHEIGTISRRVTGQSAGEVGLLVRHLNICLKAWKLPKMWPMPPARTRRGSPSAAQPGPRHRRRSDLEQIRRNCPGGWKR